MQNNLRVSFFQRFLVFCFVQVIFMIMEATGWIPNLKDFDGNFLGNIMDWFTVNEWFTFYNTMFFNVVTVFLGVIMIAEISFAILLSLVKKLSS